MKKFIITVFLGCLLVLVSEAQLKISPNNRHLQTIHGKPFFWLGDTAWELFHRLNREEALLYLKNRRDKGFTVIQAVILAELDGLNTPNAYGNKPLLNNNPATPNEAYFKHVDFIITEAEKLGLIMAILPSWGDKWRLLEWGKGPEVFTPANAFSFGEWLGRRYRNKQLVWVLGGDRNPVEENDFTIIRKMAEGLKKGDGGKHLLTYHPLGGSSSADMFPKDSWLDFHMYQTGHYFSAEDYKFNQKYFSENRNKPHINGEPRYEDHPSNHKPMEKGWLDEFEARQAAYWNMLSGGGGHTYGNHNIWQMYAPHRTPVTFARTTWEAAMNHPGSFHVGYMRRVFEKRNWQSLLPNQQIIIGENPEGEQYKVAAVSSNKDFLMVYIPYGTKTIVKTAVLNGLSLRAWWFNPRDGRTIDIGTFAKEETKEFTPTSLGRGSDWLLIVDDAEKKFPDPRVQ